MKFEIVKLSNFSGPKATFYSVIIDDDAETLFDKFINENKRSHITSLITTSIINNDQLIGKRRIFHLQKN